MSLYQDVLEAYDRLFNGEMSLEEAGQWAFDTLMEDPLIDEPIIDDALYHLVSFHPIGKLYEPWLPNQDDLEGVYSRLTNTIEG